MTRQRAARVTRGPELEAPVLLTVTQPAATVGCDDDEDDDAPTRAELAEMDRRSVRRDCGGW